MTPPVRGARVLVPLGTRQVTGCVVGTVADVPPDVELKPVIEVLDDAAFLPGHVIDLALWAAEYYVAGPGETVAAAMPPFAWVESERRVSITDAGRARLASASGDARRCGRRGAPRAGRWAQLHASRVERGGRWRARQPRRGHSRAAARGLAHVGTGR